MEEQISGLKKLIEKSGNLVNNKFISIASGKGGVGKTNFAVNFAYVLANNFGKKVLLIDADIGMGNIHILLNSPHSKNMKDLLNGAKVEDVIVNVKGIDALFGFSGIENIIELEEGIVHKLISDLNKISKNYDYVIIDNSAGIGNNLSFIRASNKSYIITTPEPTALMDAYAIIKSSFKLYGYSKFKIIINMCKKRNDEYETFEKLSYSATKFLGLKLDLAGKLSFSKNLQKSVQNKKIIAELYPTDNYVLDMKKIVSNEVGEPVKENNLNFWEKVFGFLKQEIS